jgi:hypothetical protein
MVRSRAGRIGCLLLRSNTNPDFHSECFPVSHRTRLSPPKFRTQLLLLLSYQYISSLSSNLAISFILAPIWALLEKLDVPGGDVPFPNTSTHHTTVRTMHTPQCQTNSFSPSDSRPPDQTTTINTTTTSHNSNFLACFSLSLSLSESPISSRISSLSATPPNRTEPRSTSWSTSFASSYLDLSSLLQSRLPDDESVNYVGSHKLSVNCCS